MSVGVIPGASSPAYAPLPRDCWPNIDHIVTEDDIPVDGLFSEKQMRLLCESLYLSWQRGAPFLAMANVGLFYGVHLPPLVPDVLLSLDVEAPKNPFPKIGRSYLVWEYGKAPEFVLEIVSNKEGEELGKKLRLYADVGVAYYAVWDPENLLKAGRLQIFSLHSKAYEPMQGTWLPAVDLGLEIWHGVFEGLEIDWLRWRDAEGKVLATGEEHKARAEQAVKRAEEANQRAERLAAKLRGLGIEPNGT